MRTIKKSNIQRDYQRNGNIIHHSTERAKINESVIPVELIDDGEYRLEDDRYLYYEYGDESSNIGKADRIRPLSFVRMEVNDDIELYGWIPTYTDATFAIDDNGILTLNK